MTKEELYGGKKEKPRICEVLGVEVGEVWAIRDWLDHELFRFKDSETLQRKYEDGDWKDTSFMGATLVRLINNPEDIIHISRWTAGDIEDAKAVKRLFPNAETVRRIGGESVRIRNIVHQEINGNSLRIEAYINASPETFQSLEPGKTVSLDEILEAENNDR
ncbi:MAG: hypothetical protein LUH03_09830 [Oscillospiraceae bacterium]|nr:hypothetical protein [Oscillospiraceae bacterium]